MGVKKISLELVVIPQQAGLKMFLSMTMKFEHSPL